MSSLIERIWRAHSISKQPVFPYRRRLDPDNNDIRLLVLRPGTGDSLVEGEIQYTSLNETPKYEALSYCWGEPGDTRLISLKAQGEQRLGLDRKLRNTASLCTPDPWKFPHTLGVQFFSSERYRFHATLNLESALRHLRHYTETRTLWIDAVCINQADLEEKGHQVAYMAEIYRRATKVQIWLGCGSPLISKAFEVLKMVAITENWRDPGLNLATFPSPPTWEPIDSEEANRAEALAEAAIKADVFKVFRLPWFSRMWVVQETCLATSAELNYGNDTLEWHLFDRVSIVLFSALRHYGFEDESDSMIVAMTIMRIRTHMRYLRSRFYCLEAGSRYGWVTMALSRHQCKDDRDRVYAAMHLTAGHLEDNAVKPDYTLTAEEVYSQYARKLLSNSMDLSPLSWGGLCQPRQVSGKGVRHILPSWAHDLRVEPEDKWEPIFDKADCSAASDRPPTILSPLEHRRLLIRGTILDQIEWAIGFNTRPDGPAQVLRRADFVLATELFNIMADSVRQLDLEQPDTALARTLCADGKNRHLRKYFREVEMFTPAAMLELWYNFWEKCMDNTGEVASKMQKATQDPMRTRDVILADCSEDGWRAIRFMQGIVGSLSTGSGFIRGARSFGIAPNCTVGGDLVVLFDGSQVPFVVRRVSKECPDLALIGPCFYFGVMHGELDAADMEGGILSLV